MNIKLDTIGTDLTDVIKFDLDDLVSDLSINENVLNFIDEFHA
jgi:hypothetical protein